MISLGIINAAAIKHAGVKENQIMARQASGRSVAYQARRRKNKALMKAAWLARQHGGGAPSAYNNGMKSIGIE